jgi:hypothetical protein
VNDQPIGTESANEFLDQDKMTATRRRLAFEAVPLHDLGRAQAEAERRGVPKGRSPQRKLRPGSGYYDLSWEWIERGGIGESTTLTGFLRARIEEDRQAALAAGGSQWRHNPDSMHGAIEDADNDETVTYHEGSPTREQSIHIVRFSPARILREVEAKQSVLERHSASQGGGCAGCGVYLGRDDAWHANVDLEDCEEIRGLAAVYRDHPDYQQDWGA